MKTACLVVLLVAAGCSTTPRQWVNMGWAKTSFWQAQAECYDYLNSANGRQSSMTLCMRAKGWEER